MSCAIKYQVYTVYVYSVLASEEEGAVTGSRGSCYFRTY